MKTIFFCYKLCVKVVSVDASINNIGWALWNFSKTRKIRLIRSGFFKARGRDALANCQFISMELRGAIFTGLKGYQHTDIMLIERAYLAKGSRQNPNSTIKLAMSIGALSTCFPQSQIFYAAGHKTKYGAAWLVEHYKIEKRITEHEMDAISIGHYWLSQDTFPT